MTTNPPCPKCGNPKTYLNGDTKSGFQTYRCSDKECDARFSPNPTGRPLKGESRKTGAQRSREWRERERLKKLQEGT